MQDNPELRMQILNKLMFVDKISYAELEKVTDNHDLFNYHLKELLKREYILKNEKYYTLTEKGKQFVSHMEEDGKLQKQFKVGMFISVLRKYNGNDQVLLHKRLKHPHYGYIGAVSGKLKWGESLEENLKRELMEEVGVEVLNYKVLGVRRDLFLNNNREVAGDGVFFSIVVDKWSGEVVYKNIEGEYFWHDIDKILELDKIFRKAFESGIPHLKRYLEEQNYVPYVIEETTEPLEY